MFQQQALMLWAFGLKIINSNCFFSRSETSMKQNYAPHESATYHHRLDYLKNIKVTFTFTIAREYIGVMCPPLQPHCYSCLRGFFCNFGLRNGCLGAESETHQLCWLCFCSGRFRLQENQTISKRNAPSHLHPFTRLSQYTMTVTIKWMNVQA